MNTIKINTSQNIDLEYELGSLGDRIVGYIIDLLVIIAYVIIVIAVFFGFSGLSNLSAASGITMFLAFLPIFFYDLVSEIFLNGQSLGKMAMKIKVISLTGESASLGQYLIRWLFRVIDFSMFSGLVATITVAVSDKKQRLGDIVAGTAVVKTSPRSKLSQTIYAPIQNPDYQLTYPEVINLKDSDIELIKEVLRNYHHTGNTVLTLQAQQKVEQVLRIMSKQSESWNFLSVILRDYNFVTSQM